MSKLFVDDGVRFVKIVIEALDCFGLNKYLVSSVEVDVFRLSLLLSFGSGSL